MVIDFVHCSRLRKVAEKRERMGVVKTAEVLAMRKSDDSLECLEASDSHVNSVGDWGDTARQQRRND